MSRPFRAHIVIYLQIPRALPRAGKSRPSGASALMVSMYRQDASATTTLAYNWLQIGHRNTLLLKKIFTIVTTIR